MEKSGQIALKGLFTEGLYQTSDSNIAETTILNPPLGGTHYELHTT